ncbi:MAG: deoxyguanosinetriphosphate triphosphohydrolase [Variibacter sp.]
MAIDAPRARASYASDPRLSRGRLWPQTEDRNRNAFRRDCDRIIHATAFRRLKQKTQVFIAHEGDHFRTRLTHTLEVTQMARSLARALGLDEDLAEALALAHDLGHPPFGHAGETALDDCLATFGGFDHNVQTLRVVTSLERRYPDYDGLNLTWETIEGLIKHNGPLTDADGEPVGRYRARGIAEPIRRLAQEREIDLSLQASAEAQVAAIADDIAYDAHDIDDGLRAELFTLQDLLEVPCLAAILAQIDAEHPGLDAARVAHELVRRLIARLIADVAAESARRAAERAPRSPDDVRRLDEPLVAFSAEMAAAERAIKAFLFPRMYRHPRVIRITGDAKGVVRDLFRHFVAQPEAMPEGWRDGLAGDEAKRARRAGDFIAGMTDGFALAEHARFFDSTPELR